MSARGLRNNNPGNIRKGEAWRGLAPEQNDPEFCTFIAPVYGIRAIVKILRTYKSRGIETIERIIRTWAPPSENDTKAYIASVVAKCRFDADELFLIIPGPALETLVKAIIFHENGSQPYADNVVRDAIKLAFA